MAAHDDPLGSFRERFVVADPDVVYLDGNSLGRPPASTGPAVEAALDQWGRDLVGAWDDWIDLACDAGDRLAPLLGRAPGSTVLCDSVTTNLYKAVSAVLADAMAADPHRRVVIADAGDFPTDRYVVAGVVDAAGGAVRWVDGLTEEHVSAALSGAGDRVAAVVGSAVSFVTAAIAPVQSVTSMAHANGARAVWDVSHAVGAIPLALDDWEVDVAVGCTYKYLHGGPGAPAFVSLGGGACGLRQPIHGWFGQRDQFGMGPVYEPVAGAGGWQAGTPPVLSLTAARCGIDIVVEAGIHPTRERSLALGAVLLDGWHRELAGLGFEVASPLEDDRRGGHVALRHRDASRVVRAGRAAKVITDFRPPDIVRLGPEPLICSFTEASEGVRRLAEVVRSGAHLELPAAAGRVT